MKTKIGSIRHSGGLAKFLTLFILFLALSCKKEELVITPTPTTTTKSSAKNITKFSFAALSPVVEATIDASAKTIKATLPAGTDATKLVPTIAISDKATLSPATGVVQDFSKEVSYTVTAEDATTQIYKVSITVTPAPVVTTKTIDGNNIPEVLEDLGDGVDYIVKTNITINSTKVITVKPGVKIQFDGGGAGFTISSQAALKMIGTAAKPIILEGKVATAGSWKGILIQARNVENQWEYVTISHAGGSSQLAALSIGYFGDATRMSIKNCTFNENLGYGILCNDDYSNETCFTAFSKNSFNNNSKSALKIRAVEMGNLDSESSYKNNVQKFIEVAKQDKLIDDITIKKIEVPYRIYSVIETTAKITINSGVIFEFTSDAGFEIRYNSKNGSIIANGTVNDPIKFNSYITNSKGIWKGITLEGGNPETLFNYCIFDGGGSIDVGICSGSRKSTLTFGASPCGNYPGRGAVSNCTISNSGGYGIVFKAGDSVNLKDNTFKDNAKENVFNF